MKMIKRLQYLTWGNDKSWDFSLEEEKTQGILTNEYKYLVGGSEQRGARPFSVAPIEW